MRGAERRDSQQGEGPTSEKFRTKENFPHKIQRVLAHTEIILSLDCNFQVCL